MRHILLGLPLLLSLSACLDRGEYPSLKPRAFEIEVRNATPPPPPPPAPPARPEIVARAAALVEDAHAGQRAFAAELALVRPVVALAGAADSESWITAQEAVSGLEASRAETVTALTALDAINVAGVDLAGLRLGDNDFAALKVAADAVAELAKAQEREIAALSGTLAQP